jgi:monofunctional biosynthetic peptidoglycan transglycosylase
MRLPPIFTKALRRIKNVLLILFIAHFLYIVVLKWVDPPFTAIQMISWIKGYGLKRDYVPLEEISPNARLAVMASEDQLFPDHTGFDWKSIQRAYEYNQAKPGRTIRGGSTISQQVAKNVFLWHGRSWLRKGLETYFTFMIELIWGKRRILEVYLNIAEMGKGVFGIEAASQTYFNKPSSKLTAREAAMIAACLPNPRVYTVKPVSARVQKRYPAIQVQMQNIKGDPDIRALLSNDDKAHLGKFSNSGDK